MKEKICISVDEDTVKLIEELISKGVFRNRSHAFEFEVKKISAKEEAEQ